jgi:hypothetical protein
MSIGEINPNAGFPCFTLIAINLIPFILFEEGLTLALRTSKLSGIQKDGLVLV